MSADAIGYIVGNRPVDLDARRWGPRERRFTWWNHGFSYSRNLGMRIDLVLATDSVHPVDAYVDPWGQDGKEPATPGQFRPSLPLAGEWTLAAPGGDDGTVAPAPGSVGRDPIAGAFDVYSSWS